MREKYLGFKKWEFGLIIGLIVLSILSPLLLTQKFFGIVSFTDTGQIGDTIGGITAPFVNLLAAFLVYISFRAQINANKELSQQNRLNYISNFFQLVKQDLHQRKIDNKHKWTHASVVARYLNSYYDNEKFTHLHDGWPDETGGSYTNSEKSVFINNGIGESLQILIGQTNNMNNLIKELSSSNLEVGIRSFYIHQLGLLFDELDFQLILDMYNNKDMMEGQILSEQNLALYAFCCSSIEDLKKKTNIRLEFN